MMNEILRNYHDDAYLSNIDCLLGNKTYIARTEGEGDI